jgi:hypothetical protein
MIAGTAEITNRRTGAMCTAAVAAGTGRLAGAFVDFMGGSGSMPGDSLVLRFRRADGDYVDDGFGYQLSAADIAQCYAKIDGAVLAVPPAATLAEHSFPNPFGGSSTIRYQLASPTKVTMKVYSVDGRLVRTLIDEKMSAGYYSVCWLGDTNWGAHAATGVYFYRFSAGNYQSNQKVILLK